MVNKFWWWPTEWSWPKKSMEVEKPYESIHARQICELTWESHREVDKWIDAAILDDKLIEAIFGKEEWSEIQDKIKISKNILDIDNKEKIKSMAEFKNFLEEFKKENVRRKEHISKNIEEQDLKKKLHEIELPADLQEKKDRIMACKNIVCRKDLDKYTYIRRLKTADNNDTNLENLKIIYDFLFDYKETSAEKKKRKPWQSVIDYFDKNWDYILYSFLDFLNNQEKQLNIKIAQHREKKKDKLAKETSKEIKTAFSKEKFTDKDLEEEALDIFINKIKNWEIDSINNKYYLTRDINDMTRIKDIIEQWTQKTIPAINFDNIVLNENQEKNTMIHWPKTIISKDNYFEIKVNKSKFRKRIDLQDEENLRWYIFDRLIEYIWMHIIEYRIKQIIESKNSYKWTTYKILKTDFMDDTYWWADIVVLFKLPWKKSQREEIAAIDILTSQTKYKRWFFDQEDPVKKEKIEKAKEPKFIYSTYQKLLNETDHNWLRITALKRMVVEEDAKMTYNFLSQLMKWKIENLDETIKQYFNEMKLKNKNTVDESDYQISRILNWEYEDIKIAS